MPVSLTTIGNSGLLPVSIKYIFLPKGVSQIITNTFDDNPNYECVEVDPNNQYFCSQNGVLFTKDMKTLIFYPSSIKATEYKIPKTVESIRIAAFTRFKFLEKIIIPESVTHIERHFCYGAESILKQVFVYRRPGQKYLTFIKRILNFHNSKRKILHILLYQKQSKYRIS